MTVNVRLTRSCTERYACLRALTSCFSSKSKQHRSNIITLDGVFFFTKEFLDLKQFNSTKAQAIVDCESDEDEKRDQRLISPTRPERQGANNRSAGRNTEVHNQPVSQNPLQTAIISEPNYGGIVEMHNLQSQRAELEPLSARFPLARGITGNFIEEHNMPSSNYLMAPLGRRSGELEREADIPLSGLGRNGGRENDNQL